jgi:hypothetical protein
VHHNHNHGILLSIIDSRGKCTDNIDVLVKSQKSAKNVIPAKAGIQKYQMIAEAMDPGFRRGDASLRGVNIDIG